MKHQLGVCVIGSSGAVATTVMAGVALMKRGLVPRNGMLSEGALGHKLGAVSLDDLVFGGWDLRRENAYQAALGHGVVQRHLLDEVRAELEAIRPWPGVASSQFLVDLAARNLVAAGSFREELQILERNVDEWKLQQDIERVVMVNLTSTERYCEIEDVHRTIAAFEAGLDASDPRISPAMKYFYLACRLGIPHCNFTPSLSKVPALEKLAETSGVPVAGEDGKTGQTLIKTVLAPAFAVRDLKVDGWYSTNILGNNDGRVLNDPASNKTKVTSKKSVLDSILGYAVPDHQVHIHYYRPRGDAKEAWDNIDLQGFLGEPMQLKVNFLCKDSILAAPLVLDLVRFLDVAHQSGERGIQRQLSVFFKAPYHTDGETPVHDLFKQYDLLCEWGDRVAARHAGSNGTAAVIPVEKTEPLAPAIAVHR